MLTAYMHEGGSDAGRCSNASRRSKTQPGSTPMRQARSSASTTSIPVKDEELHRKLGDLLYAQKRYAGAIREYSAVVASNPVDKAGAEFNLAQAYLAAGQRDKAQESVLAALETAPGYRPAQKLLLELQEASPKSN